MSSDESSKWRWSELAADGGQSDASKEWPHPDYILAANACGTSSDDLSKLEALCNDLESRIVLAPGWASLERIAGAKHGTFDSLRELCWREILTRDALAAEVLQGLYRLGAAFRSNGMDTATRRMAIVIQLVARQRLKSMNGFFESTDDAERLENERIQLLKRVYLPRFLARQLGAIETV